jgi:DNA helicase II / ATP-dependent DNA helicase PcrA
MSNLPSNQSPTDRVGQVAKFEKYYSQLNPEQQAAVDAIEGPVMTIAGAGTGKTQILAVRIAKILLETQIDPFNILCLTFTDAGVTAMRKRLIEIIGPTAYHIKIGTFHSFCNEVIKDNPEDFLFRREFDQIDDLEKIELLREIIDDLGVKSPIRPHGEPYHYQYDLEGRIKDLKKENFTPEKFTEALREIQHFLQEFLPLLQGFIEIKGAPKEEQIAAVSPENIFAQLNLPEPTRLQQSYLNFYQSLWNNYQNSLTGEKRADSTKRTAFKKTLKDILTNLQKDLPKQQELAKGYALYQEKMHARARYDYEDMILLVSQKFRSTPDLLRKYQELYQYILVDEYQDTNSAQNQTVELLGSYFDSPNIFVVGDDDQSIYRFQGASMENIIDFHKHHIPELKLVTLIKNYRSQQTILDAASTLIKNNQTRIATYLPKINKDLQSQINQPAEPIKLAVYQSENNENYGVACEIQKLIADGVKPSEIAVLYRNHRDAEDLLELMLKLKIPFEIKAGQDILKDLEIGKLIQLFQLIENPNANDLLSQSLFLNFLKIDKHDILKLSHYYYVNRLEKEGYSLFNLLNLPEKLAAAGLSDPIRLRKFAQKIADWKEASMNSTLNQFFETVIKESHYLEYLFESKVKLEAFNRLNTLFQEVKKLTRKNHAVTITEFLGQLKLRQENKLKLNEEPLQSSHEAVQMLTAHGSKGLEYQHVFIIKCTHDTWGKSVNRDKIRLPKGLIKSVINDDRLEQEEDERRLFYVALTRAKQQVHLSFAKFRSEQNKQKESIASLFINEIPPEYLQEVDTKPIEEQALQHFETLFFSEPEENFLEKENSLVKQLADQHIISPTSLNNYLICPRRFLYQNLFRLPQAKSPSAAMGTAIHAALEFYIKQYKKTRIKPPAELLTLKYKYFLEKELLTEKDYRERLEIGQNILKEYYQECGDNFEADTISEYNFAMHGVNIDGIRISGKVDKITFAPLDTNNSAGHPKAIVTDFKTGNADRARAKIKHGEDYWRQVIFYKILCDFSPKFKLDFKGATMQVGRVEFLEKSKIKGTCLTETVPLDQESINEVIENIRFVHQQILALNFEKIDKSDPCDRCPFYNICWKN